MLLLLRKKGYAGMQELWYDMSIESNEGLNATPGRQVLLSGSADLCND